MKTGYRAVAVSIGLITVLTLLMGGWEVNNTLSASSPPSPAVSLQRPNIIFILTDDLDARSIDYMPQLKALMVDQGVTFSNFFVTDSLCCPSRSTIQRGQYVHNHGVLSNTAPNGGFEKFYALGNQQSTIGTWLQAGGYQTALLGKYLNGYPATAGQTYFPPGWNVWASPINNGGYTQYNYTLNDNGKLVDYGNSPQDYLTDVLTGKGSDFIKTSTKPFFMYVAPFAPHQPATPAPRDQYLFPDAKAPRPPSFNETDVSDKPQYIQNLAPLTQNQIDEIDQLYRHRLQSLQAVDDMLASFIATLKAKGELDNTYIFFTSDNGFHLGQHRLQMGKQTAYEEDIKVPLIVRGPGVPAGSTTDYLTLETDFAPTFAQLAGVAAPDFVDGRSLVPLLPKIQPPNLKWRQSILVEHFSGSTELFQSDFENRQIGGLLVPSYKAIRWGNYLYVEYVTGERETYDLTKDPYELQNIYSSLSPQIVQQLSARLAELGTCSGASCRAIENKPVVLK